MSDFVSMFDVVFGTRSMKQTKGDIGNPEVHLECTNEVKPVAIKKMVCAIEDPNCKSYFFDEFGRFGKANDESKDRAKTILANDHYALAFNDPTQDVGDLDVLYDFAESREWVSFGWMGDELPDFEECYQQWKSEHNPSGEEPTLRIKRQECPRKSNTVWEIAEGLIRAVITEHLTSEGKSTNDIVEELLSEKNSTETMRLFRKLQSLAPDHITMDEKTFRTKLKQIFNINK
jgi:hypothetical protein